MAAEDDTAGFEARRVAERAARTSYGRLVAFLAARTRDVAAAEDALADAFAAALRTWPDNGVPHAPEAWLLTVARRQLTDGARRRRVRDAGAATLQLVAEEAEAAMNRETGAVPDERLNLLFVCAHPAIDPSIRTPLMLQSVLGLDAARIASALLVKPTAMAQRLVRAKAKIRDAGIPFAQPERSELPGRVACVLEAIYAAYGAGWEDVAGADPSRRGLTEEAIHLARVACELLPGEAEAWGLLALMLFCEARRPARRDTEGRFVPLSEQDPSLWSAPLITRAEEALGRAADLARPGPFQLEAAIQSAHAERARGRPVPWNAIARLYGALVGLGGGVGATIAHAAATAEAGDPASGLAILDAIQPGAAAAYQPYWACRAHLLTRLGRDADEAYGRAVGLAEDPAVRAYLLAKRALA
ncbi:MAG: RNA polymerase subunit sigma-70 [Methylobacteriaceae bacterium]|nr:RNA polymerase subunit sigma-70 [Methylobacteriaceae bacterium]